MITRSVARYLAASVCLAAAAHAFAQSPEPRKVATVEGITEYQFANGFKLLLYPDPSSARVTVNMTVLVGSRHEGYGETGMAHLLEHMVFKGTPDHRDIPKLFKEKGASFNGTTSSDRTNYFETLPAGDENLAFALELESDRLVNSFVRDEDLRTEFTVVRNEFESGENSPGRVLSQRMMSSAYEWHNYGKDTIGNKTDIERVPIKNLQAFYRKFYQPDNVVVVVAGKFNEAKALELAGKTFGSIKKPLRTLDQTYTEEPPQDGERIVTLRRVGDAPIVGVLYHTPSGVDPEFPAVQVLANLLSSQPSGRLYKALVDTKKAASVRAFAQATHDPGVIEATVQLAKGGSIEDARDTLIYTLEKLKDNPPTREEVDRAKREIIANRELAATDANAVGLQLSNWIALGDWRLYFLSRDRIEQVTPEQVKDVAAKYFSASNRTVGVFMPVDRPERTPVPARPEIGSVVDSYKGRSDYSAGEAFDPSPSAIEARVQRLAPIEGVKVALYPRKTRGNVVSLAIVLRYGDAENLKGMVEAAQFLPVLMLRGTKDLSRQQIQDLLAKNTARLSPGMGGGPPGGGRRGGGGGGGGELGAVAFSLTTKRANLPAVLDILRQVLREPTLPDEEFEIMKRQRLVGLEQGRTEPAQLAGNRLARLLSKYPKGDVRYVPTIDESVDMLRETTLDQVRSLYREYLGADHGELAIVGDFDPSEVLPIMSKMLADWKASKPYGRIERTAASDLSATRETIVTPDKKNANYLAGLTFGMKDDDADYPALVAANFILGGGTLSSRLGNRLRQKEGLSYGAGSNFSADPLDPNASLRLNAICNPANLAKATIAADEEFQKLVRDGVTERELQEAKTGLLEQRRNQRSQEQALLGRLASQLHLGRTFRHEAELDEAIEKLTAERVSAAIKKYFDPHKLIVVGAGDVAPAK